MTVQEFIAKLDGSDDVLVQKMTDAKSPGDAYAIAKGYGVTASAEEFTAEMGKLKDAVGELSDDDLEAVAGGATTTEIVSAVSSTVSAAATAASAAV